MEFYHTSFRFPDLTYQRRSHLLTSETVVRWTQVYSRGREYGRSRPPFNDGVEGNYVPVTTIDGESQIPS